MVCLGPPPNSAQRMGILEWRCHGTLAWGGEGNPGMQDGNHWDLGSQCPGFVPWSLRLTALPCPLLQFRAIPFILKSLELVVTGNIDGAISNQSLFLLGWLKVELG